MMRSAMTLLAFTELYLTRITSKIFTYNRAIELVYSFNYSGSETGYQHHRHIDKYMQYYNNTLRNNVRKETTLKLFEVMANPSLV